MKVVIDIPEETYKGIMLGKWDKNGLAYHVKVGTPLPKGKWVNKKCRDGSHLPCCSACGESSGTYYEYNYCPNCGAKMEIEK